MTSDELPALVDGAAARHRVYVMTVVFQGTPERLRADRQVTSTYLGVGG